MTFKQQAEVAHMIFLFGLKDLENLCPVCHGWCFVYKDNNHWWALGEKRPHCNWCNDIGKVNDSNLKDFIKRLKRVSKKGNLIEHGYSIF